MKQLAAAKRALVAPTVAVIERGMAKRAKVRACPYCGSKFDNATRVTSHLEKSGCVQRAAQHEKTRRYNENVARRNKGLIDPERPELGKVTKNSLLAVLLARQR